MTPGLILLTAAGKLALYLWVRHHDFGSLSADEFSRGLRALHWSRSPHWLEWAAGPWMPLEGYLNGIATALWSDPIAASRFTAFLFSVGLALAHFRFTLILFPERGVAAVALALGAVFPWVCWLSATPMLDIYYAAAFFAGAAFLARYWFAGGKPGSLAAAALALNVACAFHFQAWVLTAVVALLVLYRLWRRGGPREGTTGPLLAFVASLGIYPGLYLAGTYGESGLPLAGLRLHHEATAAYFGRNGITHGPLHYGVVLWEEAGWIYWALLGAVWIRLRRELRDERRIAPLAAAAAGFAAYLLFGQVSVPTAAAQGRYALPFVLLLVPYAAYGIHRAWETGSPKGRAAAGLMAALLVIPWVARGPSPGQGIADSTVRMGREMGRWLDRVPGARVMVEDDRWQSLAVAVASGKPGRILSDRRLPGSEASRKWFVPGVPVLRGGNEELARTLSSHRVRYLLVESPEHRVRLRRLPEARLCGCYRRWRLFCWRGAPRPASGWGRCG